ncbi:MAG TPA: hypothetical protein VH394_09590 [Thermoanaerobaculia bacterium]|nr:hypothetical protein [Thermoanaerobaculia bacterium]
MSQVVPLQQSCPSLPQDIQLLVNGSQVKPVAQRGAVEQHRWLGPPHSWRQIPLLLQTRPLWQRGALGQQTCPAAPQAGGAWQMPLVQLRPVWHWGWVAQHICPAPPQAGGGGWQVPFAAQVNPLKQGSGKPQQAAPCAPHWRRTQDPLMHWPDEQVLPAQQGKLSWPQLGRILVMLSGGVFAGAVFWLVAQPRVHPRPASTKASKRMLEM